MWKLFVDGASNRHGARLAIVLISLEVSREYEAKDSRITKYQTLVREELKKFQADRVEQTGRERNSRVDELAGLASMADKSTPSPILIELLLRPSIKELEVAEAEVSNKTVLDGLKKMLEKVKGKWTEELPNILWAYRTMPRRSTNETPFALAYGMDTVIPLEVDMPTIRSENFEPDLNAKAITWN
ncbi:uncharacterized protein LOC114289955 [Camellia sinensis]|uniref:uncharacterized protein LOC114289955 n=1 Tax=Camellia sinensis TaxID=4442 RepID=UPI00103558ED|nr:uncharacterized protein LOC114289955 [Camellia sinensis]